MTCKASAPGGLYHADKQVLPDLPVPEFGAAPRVWRKMYRGVLSPRKMTLGPARGVSAAGAGSPYGTPQAGGLIILIGEGGALFLHFSRLQVAAHEIILRLVDLASGVTFLENLKCAFG